MDGWVLECNRLRNELENRTRHTKAEDMPALVPPNQGPRAGLLIGNFYLGPTTGKPRTRYLFDMGDCHGAILTGWK
jgi:hypothetical protein